MKRAAVLLLTLSVLLSVAACSGTKKPDKITQDLLTLPKEQLFARGEGLLKKHKVVDARKYLNFVFESYPNDPLGQKALLLVADSYFDAGRSAGYVEARYRYRDYLSRYPAAANRDYALYRFALCYDKEHATPDRDPTNIREALTNYQRLLAEDSGSPYAAKARERVQALYDLLADHEYEVGIFYFHKGDPTAALGRFLYCEENYPKYSRRDRLYYYIARSERHLGRKSESDRYFARLEAEFPKSEWAEKARRENHIRVDKAARQG